MAKLKVPFVAAGAGDTPGTQLLPTTTLVYDIDAVTLRLHDGITPGGFLIGRTNIGQTWSGTQTFTGDLRTAQYIKMTSTGGGANSGPQIRLTGRTGNGASASTPPMTAAAAISCRSSSSTAIRRGGGHRLLPLQLHRRRRPRRQQRQGHDRDQHRLSDGHGGGALGGAALRRDDVGGAVDRHHAEPNRRRHPLRQQRRHQHLQCLADA
ncbi:MAG: hypothetical protein WDM81_13625 [Rhizomicrobium sp.]